MNSLFTNDGYQEILSRLEKLHKNSKRQWGKMSVGQMVWHCQYPLQLAVENPQTNSKGNLLIRLFFKKLLYNDKPWRKNLPTAPQLKPSGEKDFDVEFPKLRKLVEEVHATKDRTQWNPHPVFGAFTPKQWGQMQYKHLDHHLKQFGV